MNRTKYFWGRQDICLVTALILVLVLPSGRVGSAAEDEGVQHFKMLSTVEYAGKSQFRNLVETLFTVRKQPLSDDKVQYFISTNDFDLVGDNLNSGQQFPFKELSFVIDRKTQYLSGTSKDLAFLEKVNNQCVRSIKEITKNNIGKTWKQSFNLSSLGNSLPDEVKLTLTAVKLKTEVFGEMIVVRALSEPFVIKAAKKSGGMGPVQSRINAVYLFDPEIEEIYLSISVFEATTTINGFKERLRHEVATYRTDAAGVSADLSGLDKNFEKLVRKVGLTKKGLKVVDEESSLPQWARSEGLGAAQVANMCAAIACEGALNPVATICIPAARTVALQSAGKVASVGALGSVSTSLAKSVPALGSMKIAAAPAFMGVGLGTAGAVAGGTTAIAAGAGGGGGGSSGGSSGSSRSSAASP